MTLVGQQLDELACQVTDTRGQVGRVACPAACAATIDVPTKR
jgi:hypothetical protein